ncbi:hypothetical protein N7462_009755 [Penicillium macrosclerotiorum]|uniref:uncharacterized protein n=1 Tax=Penicillium macrosclerotiorum TaxID=303699 RepID=UPI0025473A56|nr:uncharacterized protein N7462_009755 [Penicillium macrosclerotiorum]KAJ5668685.1 hypothetical protein N7462_009755 [Penicillium macrosclerotiorum]
MGRSREYKDASVSTEDHRAHEMRGYKAALRNPRTSEEAKTHAAGVLSHDFGWEASQHQPSEEHDNPKGKDPIRVAGALKAARSNPRVTDQGRQHAVEKLEQMSQQGPEE